MLNQRAKQYIISHIRLGWRYYDMERKKCLRSEACIGCKRKTKDLYADHIHPVGHFDEKENKYIARMFCALDGLQPLCKPCHDLKTREEAAARKEKRKNK